MILGMELLTALVMDKDLSENAIIGSDGTFEW